MSQDEWHFGLRHQLCGLAASVPSVVCSRSLMARWYVKFVQVALILDQLVQSLFGNVHNGYVSYCEVVCFNKL